MTPWAEHSMLHSTPCSSWSAITCMQCYSLVAMPQHVTACHDIPQRATACHNRATAHHSMSQHAIACHSTPQTATNASSMTNSLLQTVCTSEDLTSYQLLGSMRQEGARGQNQLFALCTLPDPCRPLQAPHHKLLCFLHSCYTSVESSCMTTALASIRS